MSRTELLAFSGDVRTILIFLLLDIRAVEMQGRWGVAQGARGVEWFVYEFPFPEDAAGHHRHKFGRQRCA
jgi:hypothetical protein